MDQNISPEFNIQRSFLQKNLFNQHSNLAKYACDKKIYTGAQQTTDLMRSQAGNVIAKIEHIFESLADCVLEKKEELVIQLKTKTVATNRETDSGRFQGKIRNITFPSRKSGEAWKFS